MRLNDFIIFSGEGGYEIHHFARICYILLILIFIFSLLGVCESEPTGLHHLHPHLEIGSRSVNGKYPLGALINYRCEDNYFIKNGQTRAHCETEGWVPSQVPVCEGR